MKQPLEDLRIHDNRRFEFKLTYPLDREKKVNEYCVDAFLFIPYSLTSDAKDYSFDDFFNDRRKYFRFKTPELKLKDMCFAAGATPLKELENSIGTSLPSNDPASFVSRLCTFCSIVRVAFRDAEAAIEKKLCSISDEELAEEVSRFTSEIHSVSSAFRQLKDKIADKNEEAIFGLADEFISLECASYASRLGLFLRKNDRFPEAIQELISSTLSRENAYRQRMKFKSDPATKEGLESIIRRESLLKKLMASVLFLKVDTFRDGVIIENLVLALAAGTAMAFSTIVAFLSNGLIQDFSIAFFLLTVIAYIFKDRIKDFIRYYVFSRVRRFMFDLRSYITNAMGEQVGVCRERFRFISEKDLDKDVAKIRGTTPIRKFGSELIRDNITHLSKTIKLYSKHCEHIFADFKVDGIVDIIRFDVSCLLKKMSDPTKTLLVPIHDTHETGMDAGLLKEITIPYIYPLEVIVSLSAKGQKKTYRHVLLKLTSNGIYSVEELPLTPPQT